MHGLAHTTEADPSLVIIPLDFDVLLGAPVFWPGGRAYGRNWFATIWRDAEAPGGIARRFHFRAYGEGQFYTIADLKLGDPIEFGADELKASYRRYHRWWGVVEVLGASHIAIRHYSTARRAIKAAFKPAEELRVISA